MKKTKIIFWVFTIIFALLMLTAAIPEIQNGPDAVKFFANIGYPKYLNPFLGVTKILGIIALLVPGFPRIKEWAYAGFTFDLIGAIFSILSAGPFQPQMIFMLVFFIPLIVSYIYFHKMLKAAL
jgi:uncharacterized membrane protein YphA (DoxX/SURF4 family)